jgi:gluconolactonase
MRKESLFLMAVVLALLPGAAVYSADDSIIAPGAKLEKLADGFTFTEGPACDAEGNVFFTDQPNDKILKWSTDGKLSTFMEPAGRSNGTCFDRQGNLWACADGKNELWRIAPDKKVTVVVKDYQGQRLNGPNDVWIRADGGVYFTDPLYPRQYWPKEEVQRAKEAVYFLSPDGKKLTCVADDLKKPNGLVGTPDDKIIYLTDIGAGVTYQYDIQSDGTLANKKLFCQLGSDGMTIDDRGNVYLSGRGTGTNGTGVTVFDKTGKQIEHIDVPERWTANVCFGGKDRQTLFITASKGLYGLRMNVKGVGSE